MQYEAKNTIDYLSKLEEDWRKDKLLKIREMIISHCPNIEEKIEYKMLCFAKGNQSIFHLNAQKNYVSLYVGDIEKVENSDSLLQDFKLGKGCIRIKKNNILSETKLDDFILEVIKLKIDDGSTE